MCEIRTRFLRNIHQKWKYYREEKQYFDRFSKFLNIKMSVTSNKIELSEEFMVMWRKEQTLWDVMSSLYRDKYGKGKSFRGSRRTCSVKKLFLEFAQNLQENTSAIVSFLNKFAGLPKFLTTPFLTEHLQATASKV